MMQSLTYVFVSHIETLTYVADIGYGYGYLLANEIAENYQSLMKSLLGDKWYDEVSGAQLFHIVSQSSRVCVIIIACAV